MRRLPGAVAAAAPLLLGIWAAPLLADHLGVIAGGWVVRAVQVLTPEPSASHVLPDDLADLDGIQVESLDLPAAPASPNAPLKHGSTRSPARQRGILVRAATVLRLANAGARPSAEPVPASGSRPAGLAFVGVSGLGVGVHDGDILTDVGGASASSVAAVVNAVVAARRAHARAVGGRFWRDGEAWQLVVEMPYVE